jgi:hypothetical protein
MANENEETLGLCGARWLRQPAAYFAGLALLFSAGCEKEKGPTVDAPTPENMEISGSEVISGFGLGQLTERRELRPFRMTRHPITVSEYRGCVAAGRCAATARDACAETTDSPIDRANIAPENDELPAVCVGIRQAEQFCGWVGGKLPTPDQWQFAARGSTVQRFPWGNTEATCEQHARARPERPPPRRSAATLDPANFPNVEELRAAMAPADEPCPQASEEPQARFAIGQFPAGASASGVEDVLLTQGELLRASGDSMFAACANPRRACIVKGLSPGAIDAVEGVDEARGSAGEQAGTPYGFRCVWEQEG